MKTRFVPSTVRGTAHVNLKQIRRRMFWGEVLSVASLVLSGAFVIVPIALSRSHPGLGLLIGLAGLVLYVFPLRRSGGSMCRGTELLCISTLR